MGCFFLGREQHDTHHLFWVSLRSTRLQTPVLVIQKAEIVENNVLTLKELLPMIGLVLVGLLVIVGGLTSSIWLRYIREQRLRRTLALAFRGEVQALLEVLEKRGYIEGIRAAKAEIEATGKFQAYQFRARKNLFSVFETNVGQIGILRAPLSDLIARFYAQAHSILYEVERFGELDPASVEPMVAIAAYDEVLRVFEDTVAVGKQIVQEVSRRYSIVPF
jgi:hypothetical protein